MSGLTASGLNTNSSNTNLLNASQFSQALSIQTVLGTRRPAKPLPFDAALQDFAAQLSAQSPEPSAEQRLLTILAAWSVYGRAGQQVAQQAVSSRPPIESLMDALPEQPMPERLQRLLSNCLADQSGLLLAGWRQAARQCGGVLQAQALLVALNAGRQQVALRGILGAHLGQRAQLLASRQPDWVWASGAASPLSRDFGTLDPINAAIWQTGHASARELLFTRMRQADPAGALAHLQQVWATESANLRQAFLGVLQQGLSAADEPFLQSVLAQDRSRVVREQTVGLLSQLPNSAFADRQCQRFRRWVSWDAKTQQPVFAEIAEIDVEMVQDGWNTDAKVQDGLGAKSQALLHFISVLPLEVWQSFAAYGEPLDWLKKLQRSDWYDAVLLGLYRATCQQRNRDWAQVLLSYPFKLSQVQRHELDPVPLLLLVNGAQQQAWCLAQMKTATGRQAYLSLQVLQRFCVAKLQQMAQPLQGFWSAELTEQVSLYVIQQQNSKQYECNMLQQLLACCANLDDLAVQMLELSPEARQAEQIRRQLLGCAS